MSDKKSPAGKFKVKKKPKKLSKLSLNKDANKTFPSHIINVLNKNKLVVYDLTSKKTLLEAVSESLFMTPNCADNLKKLCLAYMEKNFNKKKTKEKLNFLKTEKFFLRDYRSDPASSIFEALNLEILSQLFEAKIMLYSIFGQNNILFSSIFNNGFDKHIQLLAVVKDGIIFYGSVFDSNSKTKKKAAWLNKEADKFEKKLSKRNEEYGVDMDDDGEYVRKGGRGLQKDDLDIYNKYDDCFGKNLNTLSHIEFNYQKMKMNEMNVSSAQKQLSAVFHQYARSVSKSTASNSRNGFFFTEEVSFENLDPESKKEIIFGEKTPNFINLPPPGLDRPMLKTKTIKKKSADETTGDTAEIKSSAEAFQKRVHSDQKGSAPEKKKPVILDESKERLVGKFKFFNDEKNYGFIVKESDGKDIFVHFGDLNKAGLTREELLDASVTRNLKFKFSCLTYIGRHNKSIKAVDLEIL